MSGDLTKTLCPFTNNNVLRILKIMLKDDFVKKLQESIRRIKGSREMEERFMIFEEMLREERAEGRVESKAEAVLEILEDLGEIPEYVREKIMNEKDLQTLTRWLKLAAKAGSFEEFLNKW